MGSELHQSPSYLHSSNLSCYDYKFAIWHSFLEAGGKLKSAENKLFVVQNRCLRKIAGAYKATLIQSLEAKTHISPISLHLNQLQTKARESLRNNGQAKLIAKACKKVAYKLQNQMGPTRQITKTPRWKKHTWSKKLVTPPSATLLPCRYPFGSWKQKSTLDHNIFSCKRGEIMKKQSRSTSKKAGKRHRGKTKTAIAIILQSHKYLL